MTTTIRQLIKNSLIDIGAIGAVDPLSAEDLALGRGYLQRLIGQWNARRIYGWHERSQEFTLPGSAQSYTVGPAASSPTLTLASQDTRPPKFDRAKWVLAAPSPDSEAELPIINVQSYADMPSPGASAVSPSAVYYAPTWPNGTLYLVPYPTDISNKLKLYWRTALDKVAVSNLDDDVEAGFPDGYEEALTRTLSEWFADGPMRKPLTGEFRQLAMSARRAVLENNFVPCVVASDAPSKAGNGFSMPQFLGRHY